MKYLPILKVRLFCKLFCSVFVCLNCLNCLVLPLEAQVFGEDAAPGRGLWRVKPSTPIPYGIPDVDNIEKTLLLVGHYIDENCPVRWVDLDTKQSIQEGSFDVPNPGLEFGLFSSISYEWGVTYAGALRAAEVTGDKFFHDYVRVRLQTIEQIGVYYLGRKVEDRRGDIYRVDCSIHTAWIRVVR